MVTILKKDFNGLVNDFAGLAEIKNKRNAIAVIFDDNRKHIFVLDKKGVEHKTGLQCFTSMFYNKGKNAIACIKKKAIVVDLVNKVAKTVNTKFIKR